MQSLKLWEELCSSELWKNIIHYLSSSYNAQKLNDLPEIGRNYSKDEDLEKWCVEPFCMFLAMTETIRYGG